MNEMIMKEIKEARILIGKSKYEKALLKMEKLYKQYPNHEIVALEYGKTLLKTNTQNIDIVRKIYLSLLNTSRKNDALYELGCLETNYGKTNRASFYLQQLIGTEKNDYALLELTNLSLMKDDLKTAKEYISLLLQNSSDEHMNMMGNLEFCKIYTIEKNYLKAKELLSKIIIVANKIESLPIYLELGKIEALLGNYDVAKECFNYLIFTPYRNYALLRLFDLELALRHYEAARFYLEELKCVDNTLAFDNLGKLELSLENYDEALKYYSLLEKKNKTMSKIGLLKLYTVTGEYDKANDYLTDLFSLNNINKMDLCKYRLFLENRLGTFCSQSASYYVRQIKDYDALLAIKQTKKNLSVDGNKATKPYNCSDISELFYRAQKAIPNLDKINDGLFDKYIYDDKNVVSNMYDSDTSLSEVITFCNSDDIISMYPVVSNVTIFPRKLKKAKIISIY